jgi:hypothetical protein
MEWAGESGLLLGNCVFETTEDEVIALSNHNTIHALCYKRDLWPDPQRLTEVEDFLHLSLFATEGSYKVEPEGAANVITAEYTVRDKGK